MIEKLKNNLAVFLYLNDEEKAFLKQAGRANCLVLRDSGEWEPCPRDNTGFFTGNIYRLKPDYQPAKKRRRVSYDVKLCEDNVYRVKIHLPSRLFGDWLHLTATPSIRGYLGTEFKEMPGRLFSRVSALIGLGGNISFDNRTDGDYNPATPTRVWFKEEVL